jgi:hypothetical protein
VHETQRHDAWARPGDDHLDVGARGSEAFLRDSGDLADFDEFVVRFVPDAR